MPLDLAPTSGFDLDTTSIDQADRDIYYDRSTAGRGLQLAQPASVPTGYASPQHAGVAAIRGYDPLRTTATWTPDAQPITEAFNPFPRTSSPKDEPGEWNYLWQAGKNAVFSLGDAGVNIGRMLNTTIGDLTTQAGGGNEWLEGQLAGWHKGIQDAIAGNIKAMGEGHRNAYEGSILRSMGIGPEQDENGNPIPGVFEGGGGVGRFANWAAARVLELVPVGVAGLLTGGTGAGVLMGAQTMGDLYGKSADHIANTDDKTYQATNPLYRDLRQTQGMTEMQAKNEMLHHAMLAAIASGATMGVAGAVGMGSSSPAWGPVLRRVWGAVVGGTAMGAAGGAGSVAEQKLMTGDVDVTTALREALTSGVQGAALGLVFGAHPRERAGTETPPGGTPPAGPGSDEAAALAAARPREPEQTEMFASTQMGPTVAPSPAPRPTEPMTTEQPPGVAPIGGEQRTPGPYAPQTYPAYGPEGPTIVSRPEGMPGASQPDILGGPTQGPSGPIVPPTPGGPRPGLGVGPQPQARTTAQTETPTTPSATQAAVAKSKAKGRGKGTSGVITEPSETAAAPITGYTTALGSTYQVHEDGTTTRNKSYHPEHGEADQGPQPRSQQTFYVTPEDANRLSAIQAQGPAMRLRQLGDGRVGVGIEEGPHAGQIISSSIVTPETVPDVGLHPVEVWNDGTRVHFGNKITEVTRAPTARETLEERLRTSGELLKETGAAKDASDQATKAKLRELGYSPADIKNLTPERASQIIAAGEIKASTQTMRQQLIEWGYKKTHVNRMSAAEVREAHAKGKPEAEAEPISETPAEKTKPVAEPAAEKEPSGRESVGEPEGEVTLAASEAERVAPEERTLFPAAPKEEGPPIAEPLKGRAAQKARMAAGKETPIKGEAAVAEAEPETIEGGGVRRELAAPENTPENRREVMHTMVQEHAPQVIQARGKADISPMVKRAADFLHRLVEETDGTREGVAERIDAALNRLPAEGQGPMPGTTTTWRNYLTQMMTRLTGHEPTSAEAERAEVEQVQAAEEGRKGAEPVRKVAPEAIEEAIAAPVQGEIGGLGEPVARKAEADTVTNVRRKAENIIKRLRDGDLTPAEAALEYDRPVEGEKRGAKRSKGYNTFREVLQTKLVQAADEAAERRILDEINRVYADRSITKAARDAAARKLTNQLKTVGREAAAELQDWLERLDDPVGKAIEDEGEGQVLRMAASDGIDPRSSRYVQTISDPRLHQFLIDDLKASEQHGVPYTVRDMLSGIARSSMARVEMRPLWELARALIDKVRGDIPVMSFERALDEGYLTQRQYDDWRSNSKALHLSRSDGFEAIILRPEADRTVEAGLHEILHAITSNYIRQLQRVDPNHAMLQALHAIQRELWSHALPELKSMTNLEKEHFNFATENPHETLSWLMTNPELQAWMARHEASASFRSTMARLGFPPREPGRSLWRYFTDWIRRSLGMAPPKSASEYTLLDHVMRPLTDITQRAAQYNERMLPKDPVLRGPAGDSYDALHMSVGPMARQAMDTVSRTMDFGRLSDARRGLLMRATPLDRLVDRFGDAMPGLHTFRLTQNMIQYAGKQFSDKYADEIKATARRITSADNRNDLQSLMNEATLNEMHLRPGGDNSHLTTPEQQTLLRELRTRYNNLSARDRETYNLTTDLHNRMYQDIRDAQVKSMVNIHMPDATEAEANAFVRAARTREGLDRYVEDTDQAHRDVVKAIADFHKLGYVNGDYFPLRRYGNYVVRYGDRDDLNSYGVEFFENRAKAEDRIKELKAQNVPDVYRLDAKDARNINEIAPSHPAVETLISRLARSGMDEEQQALVREQMSRIMVQQATRSARSRLQQTYRRRGIRGASEDQARALHYDFIANSQTIGHLLWGSARARSLIELRDDVDNLSKPGVPDTALDPVVGRTIANEMARRSNRLNDPDNVVYKLFRGVNLYNYLHSLGSFSHMVTSTMDAHTNSMALGGARYGYGRFGLNLTRALGMLTPEMAKTGVVNTIKGVRGELAATDWNLGHLARDRAIKAGLNAEDMRKLFDLGEKNNLIDHTIMTDLRRGATGPSPLGERAGDYFNRYLNFMQASAHATDVNNKAAIMIAAYLSHLSKFEGDREGAINAGLEYGRKSMPNYSQANKGSIDRYLGPLLQFKRYGIHELTLMANLARESMHGEHKFESAKALAGIFLTRAMMAGAITTVADPLKYIMGAWDYLTGKPGPNNRQAAIRGWLNDTFGQTLGEVIGRGLPHAAGFDVSHRVGLENLLELPELRSFDKSGFGEMLLGLTTGASGESLQDIWQGLGKLVQNGDVAGMLKGIVPRLFRDPMKAFDLAEKGVTDSKGKVILPASRIGAGALAAQAIGFQPTTVSEFREGRNAVLEQREELTSEHSRLEQKWLNASPADRPDVLREIHTFNADETTRRWGMGITMDQLLRAQAAGRKAEHAPFGLRLPTKSIQGARYVGRFANTGAPVTAAP